MGQSREWLGEKETAEERGKAQGRKRAVKNPLVGHVQKKIVMAEEVRPEEQNGDWSQLKKPLKTAGTKT